MWGRFWAWFLSVAVANILMGAALVLLGLPWIVVVLAVLAYTGYTLLAVGRPLMDQAYEARDHREQLAQLRAGVLAGVIGGERDGEPYHG